MPFLAAEDVTFRPREAHFAILKRVAEALAKRLSLPNVVRQQLRSYAGAGLLLADHQYLELLRTLPRPSFDKSLAAGAADIAAQWHPTKNSPLSPADVHCNSNRIAWWQCSNGHEWKTQIASRVQKKVGCSFCSGRRVSAGNNLAVRYPTVAAQWHPTKNGAIGPGDVTTHSPRRVWWQCAAGHEWEVAIYARTTGNGCPSCAGQRPTKERNLAVVRPDIAAQWHPTKNGTLMPVGVLPNSNKKVWWQCAYGHEWFAAINNRTRNCGCPLCSGRSRASAGGRIANVSL